MTAEGPDLQSAARGAAATAALELVEPGMALGLGSGRALWAVVEGIGRRWPHGPPVRAVAASERTAELARAAGIELAELDGELELDLALDGADELDDRLGLVKGGGGALLREKIVICAARRFVVVAEERKRVDRLGRAFRLPVEIVPFAWRDTRARVVKLVEDALLREDEGAPYLTDEGHWILDCRVREEGDLRELAADLDGTVGVVEHGLFLDMAAAALLGRDDGSVAELVTGT
ncbi:MAG: ribose-5-phosphate isomerase RpiA [Thermoleophilaceae bacterium]